MIAQPANEEDGAYRRWSPQRKAMRGEGTDYLADILPGLANAPLRCIAQLTPAAWAARHPHLSTVGLL